MEPATVYLALVIAVLAVWLVGERVWDLAASVASFSLATFRRRPAAWIIAALVGTTFMRVASASAQTVPPRERIIVDAAVSVTSAANPMRTLIGSQVSVSESYTVKAGDCLWRIARTVLVERGVQHHGSAISDMWRGIYELNRDVIGDNPDLIHPGQVLQIPTR